MGQTHYETQAAITRSSLNDLQILGRGDPKGSEDLRIGGEDVVLNCVATITGTAGGNIQDFTKMTNIIWYTFL